MRRWGSRAAIAALGMILIVTAAWWTLALWPMPEAPQWLLRTRAICFGSPPSGLPTTAGWVVLLGEPIGLLLTLVAIAGNEVRDGLARMASRLFGRAVLAVVAGAVLIGLGLAGHRVVSALSSGPAVADGTVVPVDWAAPELALTDQNGNRRDLLGFQGRPALVAFAFAHCETVCPALIANVTAVQRAVPGSVLLIVTVDPWRDPPSRLPSIARQWGLGRDQFVLSGSVEEVGLVLTMWRVAADRNPLTGDVVHAAAVRVVGADGRIRALVDGGSRAAIRRALEFGDP